MIYSEKSRNTLLFFILKVIFPYLLYMSKGEEKIIKILRHAHIGFQREKYFGDLRKGRYRFDFYIPSLNICIEFDGEQHFRQVAHFQRTRHDFLATQERDRRKNSYCLAHRISLYRIPYYDIDKISTFTDLLQDKYQVKSKWHTDLLIAKERGKE